MVDAREIYRDWLRELKDDYREFGAIRADEMEGYYAVEYHYSQFLTDLAMRYDEEPSKVSLKYIALGEKEVYKVIKELVKKFPEFIETEEQLDALEEDPEGFNPITGEEAKLTGAIRRKRLFPDLASLVEYIRDVPYPAGVQTVRDIHGRVLGYYVWVEK